MTSKTIKQKATLGGGCFWCMVKPFDQYDGIDMVISGYGGGNTENPTYEEVKWQLAGHVELVQVTFDPSIISYEEVLAIYWQTFDPTDATGQFYDRGVSYRPVIFYHDEEQQKIAQASRDALDKSGRFDKPVVVPIEPFKNFYPAESYHQDFYKKSPEHYEQYQEGSGRKAFIEKYWGKK